MYKLILLVIMSLAIFSCQNPKPQEEMIPVVLEDTTFLAKKSLTGVDFYATGNEPFWALSIIEDSLIHFSRLAENDSINFDWTKPQQIGGIKRFTLSNNGDRLTISLRPDSCQDTMSGEMFDHIVTMDYKASNQTDLTNYTGCGRYVPDYQLTGHWELKELEGNAIQQENGLREIPNLNINPFESQFNGNSGCNSISGSLAIESDHLYFTNIRASRMSCPSPLEEALLQTMGLVNQYTIEGNQMNFYQEDKLLATWMRVRG